MYKDIKVNSVSSVYGKKLRDKNSKYYFFNEYFDKQIPIVDDIKMFIEGQSDFNDNKKQITEKLDIQNNCVYGKSENIYEHNGRFFVEYENYIAFHCRDLHEPLRRNNFMSYFLPNTLKYVPKKGINIAKECMPSKTSYRHENNFFNINPIDFDEQIFKNIIFDSKNDINQLVEKSKLEQFISFNDKIFIETFPFIKEIFPGGETVNQLFFTPFFRYNTSFGEHFLGSNSRPILSHISSAFAGELERYYLSYIFDICKNYILDNNEYKNKFLSFLKDNDLIFSFLSDNETYKHESIYTDKIQIMNVDYIQYIEELFYILHEKSKHPASYFIFLPYKISNNDSFTKNISEILEFRKKSISNKVVFDENTN